MYNSLIQHLTPTKVENKGLFTKTDSRMLFQPFFEFYVFQYIVVVIFVNSFNSSFNLATFIYHLTMHVQYLDNQPTEATLWNIKKINSIA